MAEKERLIEPELCFTEGRAQRDLAVLVTDGTIAAVGSAAELRSAHPEAAPERWEHLALVPGTVNAHNHSFQSLLRGIAADKPFLTWRDESLYKYSPRLRPEDIYTGALFSFAEMMKCGATTVCDFFYLHNDGVEGDEAVIRAARDLGIRLVLARTMYDWTGAPAGYVEKLPLAEANTEMLMKRYQGGMTKVIPAPHSLHAASPEMVEAGHALAVKYGTPFHIHVSEERFEVEQVQEKYGKTPLAYLDALGVVDEHIAIIHGVWLTKEEIRILSEKEGLPTWNKPSFACLATRFPYGTKITEEKLRAVEAAEQLLFDLGFLQFRVRCHGDIARIEVLPAQLPKLVENREAVIARFHALGFRYVTMDLEGFRSGSMDGK